MSLRKWLWGAKRGNLGDVTPKRFSVTLDAKTTTGANKKMKCFLYVFFHIVPDSRINRVDDTAVSRAL